MKPLSVAWALTDAVLVVTASFAARTSLQALYRSIPEYHAFWSGVALYTEILSLLFLPGLLVFGLLNGRTRFARIAAPLASTLSAAMLVVAAGPGWGAYWFGYGAGILAIFGVAAIYRRPARWAGAYRRDTEPKADSSYHDN